MISAARDIEENIYRLRGPPRSFGPGRSDKYPVGGLPTSQFLRLRQTNRHCPLSHNICRMSCSSSFSQNTGHRGKTKRAVQKRPSSRGNRGERLDGNMSPGNRKEARFRHGNPLGLEIVQRFGNYRSRIPRKSGRFGRNFPRCVATRTME